MPNDRLTLAFEQMGPHDWRLFERFAAEFLAVDYPSLRTMAAAAGDKGRDGELYQPEEQPTVAVQYSVTINWRSKIVDTFERLATTMPRVSTLIYATNQIIGPEADDLRQELLAKRKKFLDVRDASWFAEREVTHEQRRIASEELIERFVAPLLVKRGIARRVAPPLDTEEARVALLHLTLDGYDARSDRGLTKSCFDSLVVSALHDTSAENVMSEAEVCSRVLERVPASSESQARALVSSALQRLVTAADPAVKRRGRSDSYHLSYSAKQRLEAATSDFLRHEQEVISQLRSAASLPPSPNKDEAEDLQGRTLKSCMDAILLRRGEAFVGAMESGEPPHIEPADVLDVAQAEGYDMAGLSAVTVAKAVVHVLSEASLEVQSHLRRLADGYTLFAFLRQTPDVQKVFMKVFSDADIWLDTTVILPLLAETLIDIPAERQYGALIQAAKDAGIRLFVTDGIVEEVESHIYRCIQFSRMDVNQWRTEIPFLSAVYALTGRAKSSFTSWSEEFRGNIHAEEDVRLFLQEELGISRRNLADEADSAPIELRGAVQELWMASHEKRRQRNPHLSEANSLRMVAHDVENCVGVIQKRKGGDGLGPMGYRAWWLTLDRTALRLGPYLRDQLGSDAPRSPTLSPDFLTELLRLGPMRVAVERGGTHSRLPIFTDVSLYESLPTELVQYAEQVRSSLQGLSERVIRRRVRDSLDELRWRQGDSAKGGSYAAKKAVEERVARIYSRAAQAGGR